MSSITLIDCTFRDGGYYTDWDFSTPLVKSYLHAVAAAGIDVVEIGFRHLPQDRFLGAFAYSTDDFLASLPLPKNVVLGVMVTTKDLLGYKDGAAAVDRLFRPASQSPVGLVRV